MEKKQQKVLIIDDDDRNIFALKAVLTSRGFACAAAENSFRALDILKEQKDISAALIDMMMPGIDGYELMGMVRKIPGFSHVKLIAVTAQAMNGDREKCLAAGADAYLPKPVNVGLLLQILNEPLKKRGW